MILIGKKIAGANREKKGDAGSGAGRQLDDSEVAGVELLRGPLPRGELRGDLIAAGCGH